MRIGAFEIHEPVPELHEPHALTMVRPWVDVGSVVSLTLARLESHFGAKELGKLARPGNYFDFTRYRPTIRLIEGKRDIVVPNSIIHYAQPEDGPDLMFFHLLEPHAFGEDYADSVLELFKHFGIRRYCRLGAMYDVVPHTRPLIVTGDTAGVAVKEDANIIKKRKTTYQGPTSITNLVSSGVPKLDLEIDSINFMVHLPQYIQLEEDPVGAVRLLQALSSIYDLPPDLMSADKGQLQYNELNKTLERNPELKALISRLEADYDAEETESVEQTPSAPLSPEVEKFLEEMDQRFGEPDSSSS